MAAAEKGAQGVEPGMRDGSRSSKERKLMTIDSKLRSEAIIEERRDESGVL